MSSKFRFKRHFIDLDMPEAFYGQTALADLDGDGALEFITGQMGGKLFVYKFETPEKWHRFEIGADSPSDVGVAVLDVDGDGHPDLVVGSTWYRNPGRLDAKWERICCDETFDKPHDVCVADIDGDGRAEVLTMSDRHNLRWYKIPDNPRDPWESHFISPAVHAGLSVGDIDGDGTVDIVRGDRWLRNVNGNGDDLETYFVGPSTMPPMDFRVRYSFDGTITRVRDMNGDGVNDILITDAEIPGGCVWWMQNVRGDGTEWKRHDIFNPKIHGGPRRGAFHSLVPIDMDGDGDIDVVTAEMEAVPGAEQTPKYYIFENVDGKGTEWAEHVILDENLGGHELVAGDVTGNGKIDVIGKPWRAVPTNGLGGRYFIVFLENVS